MRRHLLLGALAACTSSCLVSAQTVVIPTGYDVLEAASNNSYPWGLASTAWSSMRHQQVYDTSNFTNQSINSPILITGMKLREDGGGLHPGGTVHTNVVVQMASATVDHTAISAATAWGPHLGPDLQTVFTGNVTSTASAGTTPNNWIINVVFTSPFLFDPSAGADLVIDVDRPLTGSSSFYLDTAGPGGTPSPAGSRVYGYPAPAGSDIDYALVCELSYTPAAGYATKLNYGGGCYDKFASFYEDFAPGTNDLTGRNMTLLNAGGGYTAIGGIATFQPTTAATVLTLGDDSEVTMTLTGGPIPTPTGPTNQLTVCSNGFISVAIGNGVSFTPSANAAINNPQTAWYSWHDYNPAITGSGQVKWQETPTHVYVTWDNVFSYATTGPGSTFQYQFEKSTGHIAVVWVNIDNTGNGHLVGYSPGGPNQDPGNMDLSVALASAFNVSGADIDAISYDGDARPVIGTTINMNVVDIPSGSLLGAVIFGLTKHDPGINLAPFGMNDCFQYCSQEAVLLILSPGTTATRPFPIPNDPGLAGVIVLSQAAAYDPAGGHNSIGAVTSNGVQLTLDVN